MKTFSGGVEASHSLLIGSQLTELLKPPSQQFSEDVDTVTGEPIITPTTHASSPTLEEGGRSTQFSIEK